MQHIGKRKIVRFSEVTAFRIVGNGGRNTSEMKFLEMYQDQYQFNLKNVFENYKSYNMCYFGIISLLCFNTGLRICGKMRFSEIVYL